MTKRNQYLSKVQVQYNTHKIVVKIENNYTKSLLNKTIDKFSNSIHWNPIRFPQGKKKSNRKEVERIAFDLASTTGITKLIDSFWKS